MGRCPSFLPSLPLNRVSHDNPGSPGIHYEAEASQELVTVFYLRLPSAAITDVSHYSGQVSVTTPGSMSLSCDDGDS